MMHLHAGIYQDIVCNFQKSVPNPLLLLVSKRVEWITKVNLMNELGRFAHPQSEETLAQKTCSSLVFSNRRVVSFSALEVRWSFLLSVPLAFTFT
jgi:hypothetical protein